MTKTQARKILGISSSVGLKSAERIYRQKRLKVQYRMAPGNIRVERHKAKDDLLELSDDESSNEEEMPKLTKRRSGLSSLKNTKS